MANYNFPLGIGSNAVYSQPYMLLTSYESKNAIESQTKILSSIALYIPPNALKTAFTATWSEQEGAATKAAMGAALGVGGDMGDILGITAAAGKGATIGALTKAAQAIEKGTGMLAAQGLAINNHMALTYKGPTAMRDHSFAFKFFPKNVGEANMLKDILKDLENGMLPTMGGGASLQKSKMIGKLSQPFFKAPRHWTIDFFTKKHGKADQSKAAGTSGNQYLFKIKKSVITAMEINHDPTSTISFHNDGSPVETDLSLTFKEIELPISDKG